MGCKKEGGFLCASCKDGIVIRRIPEQAAKHYGVAALYAATDYRTPLVRDLVARYKYEFAQELSADFTDMLASHLRFAGFVPHENQIVIPVPLHAKRARWRGFNQAALIAQDIARRLAIPFRPQALARVKNTVPQIEMRSRAQRLANIAGAFSCTDAHAVKNKTAILVDDVTTTGGTLGECAKALKRAGARSVIAFVVAS